MSFSGMNRCRIAINTLPFAHPKNATIIGQALAGTMIAGDKEITSYSNDFKHDD
jgi:hypothetical protein